jgi:hypothetical protein
VTDAGHGLRPFVEALRIDRSNRLLLGEDPVRSAPGRRDPDKQLAADLTLCAYEHAYAHRFPRPNGEPEPSGDIAAALAVANDTSARIEDGWRVVQVGDDGSVVAERHGCHRRYPAGRYLTADGVAPPRAGGALTISFPAGSSVLQPGFHHCFSAAPRNPDDPSPLVRFYFNARLSHASALVGAVTAALNRYAIPFELKMTTRSEDFSRRDNMVLYVSQDLFRVTGLALASAMPAIVDGLDDDVPLFTKWLAPGIGLAEDPRERGESFGSARCRLVAAALLAARDEGGFPYDRFAGAFERAAAAEGLLLDALWLNPGSTDDYCLPVLRAPRA